MHSMGDRLAGGMRDAEGDRAEPHVIFNSFGTLGPTHMLTLLETGRAHASYHPTHVHRAKKKRNKIKMERGRGQRKSGELAPIEIMRHRRSSPAPAPAPASSLKE